jgi:hypothetical protein
MPATNDVHRESCAKIDDRPPDRRTDEAVLSAGCACPESPTWAALGVAAPDARAAEDRLKWDFLQRPDRSWSWQCIRVDAESNKRFATLVVAMEDADGHGPGVSEFGRIERIDDDDRDGLH